MYYIAFLFGVHISLSPVGQKLRFKVSYRNSIDAIESHYKLVGQGIESRWRELFLHSSIPALGPPSLLKQWVNGLLPRFERLGRGLDHPPQCRAQIQEIVDLYFYST
jgi:hypothetical protein